MEKYVKFFMVVKEWYKKKTRLHECVVCKHYDGVSFKDDEICETGFCKLRQETHNYKDECHSFKPRPLSDFIDFYFY